MRRRCLVLMLIVCGNAWAMPRAGESLPAFAPKAGNPTNPFALATISKANQVQLAHAILVKAEPEKESVISDVPKEVLLTFDAGVGEEFMALAVVDAAGKRVDKHDVHQDFTDRSHLRASLEALTPGRYMVRYRVLSADGHVVSGKYFFELKDK